jgi:hypothetical protein
VGRRSLSWFAMLDELTTQTKLEDPVWQKASSEGCFALLVPQEMPQGGRAPLAQGSR